MFEIFSAGIVGGLGFRHWLPSNSGVNLRQIRSFSVHEDFYFALRLIGNKKEKSRRG